jgi:uncharacterized membrane protein YdjX (TVP38/TMEM64 family)
MVAAYAMGLHHYLSLQSLAEHRRSLRDFTESNLVMALALFVLVYGLAVTLSFPGAAVLTMTGGFLFGWWQGGLASICGATLGSIAIFQISKSSFGDHLARRAGPALVRIKEGFAADAFNYLLFLRLAPVFPFWLVNIAAALAQVPLRSFALATFLGIMPAGFAYSFAGAGLDGIMTKEAVRRAACVVERGETACPFDLPLDAVFTRELLLAFAALGIVALIPVAFRKWKSRNEI